jgi:hypothetical protein
MTKLIYLATILNQSTSPTCTNKTLAAKKTKVVELLEYNEAGENSAQLRRLLQLWGSRLPRKAQLAQMGDVESWDDILMSRLTVLTITNVERERELAHSILMSRLTVLTIPNAIQLTVTYTASNMATACL